jgi:putative photosynthetic complex assembly protein 2
MTAPLRDAGTPAGAADVAAESTRARGPIAHWLHDHWGAVGKGTFAVVGFWWFVTGVVVALQRNQVTKLIAWILSTLIALYATHVIHTQRVLRTASSARRTFMAATAIWMWINVGLYGGWIVGPGHAASVAGEASVFRATEAIASLLWHELLCVTLLFGMWLHVRLSPNRLALHGLLTYWAVLQVAKLNIFFGVANPGARFLPAHLEFLLSYYGPPVNTGWLPVSFFAAVGVALIFWWRGWQAKDAFLRQSRALLAMLIALAALEYLLLGVKSDAPLWEVFLKARGY